MNAIKVLNLDRFPVVLTPYPVNPDPLTQSALTSSSGVASNSR